MRGGGVRVLLCGVFVSVDVLVMLGYVLELRLLVMRGEVGGWCGSLVLGLVMVKVSVYVGLFMVSGRDVVGVGRGEVLLVGVVTLGMLVLGFVAWRLGALWSGRPDERRRKRRVSGVGCGCVG